MDSCNQSECQLPKQDAECEHERNKDMSKRLLRQIKMSLDPYKAEYSIADIEDIFAKCKQQMEAFHALFGKNVLEKKIKEKKTLFFFQQGLALKFPQLHKGGGKTAQGSNADQTNYQNNVH